MATQVLLLMRSGTQLVTEFVDCHRRSRDISFLEKRLSEYPFLLAQSYFCRYRLVDGQIVWPVGHLFRSMLLVAQIEHDSDVSRDY